MKKTKEVTSICLFVLIAFCFPFAGIAQKSIYTKPIQKDIWIGMKICPSSSACDAGGYKSNSRGLLFTRDGGNTWEQANYGEREINNAI